MLSADIDLHNLCRKTDNWFHIWNRKLQSKYIGRFSNKKETYVHKGTQYQCESWTRNAIVLCYRMLTYLHDRCCFIFNFRAGLNRRVLEANSEVPSPKRLTRATPVFIHPCPCGRKRQSQLFYSMYASQPMSATSTCEHRLDVCVEHIVS